MVRMTVLASGSRGNCTVVTGGRTSVLVDAGVSCREILKRMQMAGEDPAKLDAILITHEHQDHVQGLSVLARRLGIPVYFTQATHRAWMRWMVPQRRMTYADWLAARKAEQQAKQEAGSREKEAAETANPFYREDGLRECAEEQAEFAREMGRERGEGSGVTGEGGIGPGQQVGTPGLGNTEQEQQAKAQDSGGNEQGLQARAPGELLPEANASVLQENSTPTGGRATELDAATCAPDASELPPAAQAVSSPMVDPCSLPGVEYFESGKAFAIGDLRVTAFTIPHDAADPVGFVLESEGVRIGLATDLGYMPANVSQQLKRCDVVMLESNHDLDMLRDGPYPWSVKQRVLSRVGHLSNAAAAEFLEKGYDGQAAYVVLAHLSASNNMPELARVAAEWALRDRMNLLANKLLIARQHEPTESICL